MIVFQRGKIKALALLVIVAMCAGLCGCGKAEPETPATALAAQIHPEHLANLAFSDQQRLFWDYYTYFVMEDDRFLYHTEELRNLPDFAPGEQPDWEQAGRFLLDFTSFWYDAEGYVCWNAADLQQAADILLPGYIVLPQDNGWILYHPAQDGQKAYYQAMGWDAGGGVYYRLNTPVTEKAGVYTACFTGYAVGEFWQEELDFAPAETNDAKLCQIALSRGIDPYNFDLAAELPAIIDAGELTPCEEITVTFRLSGDGDLPLSYTSCERTELATN